MKNRKIWSLLFLLIAFGGDVMAQADAQAKAILSGVSKKYRSYAMVKTDFSFTLKNPQTNINETQSGSLYVKPSSNKYKVNLGEQELISDGKVQWTYLKNDNEVQISEIDNSSDALNPAKIFTMYEKGFKYVYLGDTKSSGKVYQNIELAPLQNRSFSKVKLRIDKLAKQISNIIVYDKNGNTYTYYIKSFTPNVKVDDAFFTFDASKHPGVDVVDLR
ncbi:MAG: outer membrane lipoprotein carrier protein LolA [Bacteroidetes bacterium]|nr:outer membrane lipoprotein carrier protein LolA [Bacteroidota bacterium]MBU1371695.1 outer membrane lipoprotein carrier protein LolA [Bacteroidota bacterium]MBU1484136.1 outer membrane lipoprotein carrier protein LolA [Bacteroidota bacterium]MBU1761273.1 outer membrane lipoprotein carrier protein LolA [Bacteroidota bacterium]MBU2267359.1 outer membrane lipoprotein carrier protein LolA [Bacteroidota bacterium]